uniref:MATH domain-containing protein n=1 Tax=Leersia perrieri TaxID=77586 RepID=A0A0D9XKM9_9ORYZ
MGNSCFCANPDLREDTNKPTFIWKIHNFSALLQNQRGDITASASFRCCGYKWTLNVIPFHSEQYFSSIPYIVLGLSLVRSSFKKGYSMNVGYELSIYNHSNEVHSRHKASHKFHVMDTHANKTCLISLDELKNSAGLLVDDTCIFGVKILKIDVFYPEKRSIVVKREPTIIRKEKSVVIKREPTIVQKEKSVVIKKEPTIVYKLFLQKKQLTTRTYTWTINNFLDLESNPSVCSPTFGASGYKWNLRMHPHGDMYSTDSLSLFLILKSINMHEYGKMIEVTLSILDQKYGVHIRKSGRFVFVVMPGWGWSNFIPLKKFKDPSRGYLVGSNCKIEAKISIMGTCFDV